MTIPLPTLAAAAALALAAPTAALAADAPATKPQESWTGETVPEQREDVTANPEAETVRDPVVAESDPDLDMPDNRTMPVSPDDVEDEAEEVNEATEQFKERMIEASPKMAE